MRGAPPAPTAAQIEAVRLGLQTLQVDPTALRAILATRHAPTARARLQQALGQAQGVFRRLARDQWRPDQVASRYRVSFEQALAALTWLRGLRIERVPPRTCVRVTDDFARMAPQVTGAIPSSWTPIGGLPRWLREAP